VVSKEERVTGGSSEATSSRLDEVLRPDFAEDLAELSVDELRQRRDLALAEREFLSYLRRLVQVRQDLLNAERDRRSSGGEQESLVDRLRTVLAEGPSNGASRGEAVRFQLSDGDLAEAERRAIAMAPEAGLMVPDKMSGGELDELRARLNQEERTVSSARSKVLAVHDRLQNELKRRYREDPASIPTGS
jgi:hypothetical protein